MGFGNCSMKDKKYGLTRGQRMRIKNISAHLADPLNAYQSRKICNLKQNLYVQSLANQTQFLLWHLLAFL